jgi:adenylyltransferase/sulfurtransferase
MHVFHNCLIFAFSIITGKMAHRNLLSESEKRRYAMHIKLPGVGEEGQQKLKDASVLIIGAGGLGCPVLQYLTAAGTGNIGLVDFDMVSESNLPRQILYRADDRGKLKTIISKQRLNELNDHVNVEILNIRFNEKIALDLLDDYDIIVDATDNHESRYIINDACIVAGKPMVHGAIYRFEGQVSVFNYNNGPSYRCYNPETENDYNKPEPSENGMINVLPGITGTYMANEVIKIILQTGKVLSGEVLIFNILTNKHYLFKVKPDPYQRSINIFNLKSNKS